MMIAMNMVIASMKNDVLNAAGAFPSSVRVIGSGLVVL
jgi:hypothetical protein